MLGRLLARLRSIFLSSNPYVSLPTVAARVVCFLMGGATAIRIVALLSSARIALESA